MKKYLSIVMILLILIGVSACKKEEKNTNPSALAFKEEYESLNGKTNASGKEHRTVTIDQDNPFEKVEASKIAELLNNKETFYVYFGDPLCPWCRSVIEKSIEVANKNNISKIYYVKVWDEDGNEILRSKYTLDKKNKPKLITAGTEAYELLLKAFDNVLSDYNLQTSKGKTIKVGEKRIYAPNFIYVKEGKAEKLISGYSEKQTDAREELTKEMLEDEEKIFDEFFKN